MEVDYKIEFENEYVQVAKAKIKPFEEIGFHRDVYPQIVIALEGGTITRLEANGTITEVEFPEGVPVFRKADPIDELHRSVNRSDKPVELIMIHLKCK